LPRSYRADHRGPIRDADRIAVIQNGEIAELGTHDQLTACHGAYSELCRTSCRRSLTSVEIRDFYWSGF
jgi:ABC-type transport system involved in cytochrome bd biosynthesis fused ATPase/permease subunit